MSTFSSLNRRDLTTVVLEGNIGAGKTAVKKELKKKYPEFTYIDEPLNDFCTFKRKDGTKLNPLEIFYSEPSNAIVTQLYFLDIYNTRVKEIERREDIHPIVICDRWITSCKVFTDALKSCKHISSFAWEYFIQKYDEKVNTLPLAFPTAIYFVDTPVDLCIERQQKRGREMEIKFTSMKKYMEELENSFKHMVIELGEKSVVQTSRGTTISERVKEVEDLIARLV